MFLRRQLARHYALLYILLFSYSSSCTAKPVLLDSSTVIHGDLNLMGGDLSPVQTDPLPSPSSSSSSPSSDTGPNILMSWLLGVLWGDDSVVSVVDRRPIVGFTARPAAFGPPSEVLGYMIKVEDFSLPCGDDVSRKNRTSAGDIFNDDDNNDSVFSDYHQRRGQGHRQSPWKVDLRQGCAPICFNESKQPESAETWIALVMRGGCTFVEKIREAQRLGAKGVVVGGATPAQDSRGDGLVQMYSLEDSSDIIIPSVYITHDSYHSLSSIIASSNTSTWGFKTVSTVITIDITGWQWYSPIITFLLLLFLPSILTLFTILIHRCRAARAARRERAPEEVVQNLPWSIWEGQETVRELEKGLNAIKAEQKASALHQHDSGQLEEQGGQNLTRSTTAADPESSATSIPPIISSRAHCEASKRWFERQVECAICLEEFAIGDKVRVLPCRHIFHMEEVDDWLIHRKKVCPICKHDVTRPLNAECTITPEPNESTERTRLLG